MHPSHLPPAESAYNAAVAEIQARYPQLTSACDAVPENADAWNARAGELNALDAKYKTGRTAVGAELLEESA